MGTTAIDQSKLDQFMGQMVTHMTGRGLCFAIWLGDKLGLYRTLVGAGPTSADELADKAACHPRLVREWLDSQAAGGLIDYDAAADCYELSPEAAEALADEDSPNFVARAMAALGAFYIDIDKVAAAFRGDGALGWGEHHPCLFSGTEWFFRAGYRAALLRTQRSRWATQRATTATSTSSASSTACMTWGAARHAREHLTPDGAVMLVEPFALDGRPTNISGNPMAALLYTASSAVCTPNSLSQEVGLGLGAQAGMARTRELFEEAGFSHFRKVAETPLNLVMEARP